MCGLTSLTLHAAVVYYGSGGITWSEMLTPPIVFLLARTAFSLFGFFNSTYIYLFLILCM